MRFTEFIELHRKSGVWGTRLFHHPGWATGPWHLLVEMAITRGEKHRLIHNKIVISTGAYPDFLPRNAGHGHVCGFL